MSCFGQLWEFIVDSNRIRLANVITLLSLPKRRPIGRVYATTDSSGFLANAKFSRINFRNPFMAP